MYNKKNVKIIKKNTTIEGNSAVIVIDVFRATSTMYYLFNNGTKRIYPVESIEKATNLKRILNNAILLGEEQGKKPDCFLFNNSPTDIINKKIKKDIIMSTSSGTKAICKYKNHDVYIGSLLNAKYLSEYLNKKQYKTIYLLPTNNKDRKKINEDYICAKYIMALIKKQRYFIVNKIKRLQKNKNLRFFKEELQERFPKNDFYLCTTLNIFDFILIYKDNYIKKGV